MLIHRAEGLPQLSNHLRHGGSVSHVRLKGGGLTTGGGELLHQLLCLILPVQIVDAYGPALMGQFPGHGAANAPGGPSNECGFHRKSLLAVLSRFAFAAVLRFFRLGYIVPYRKIICKDVQGEIPQRGSIEHLQGIFKVRGQIIGVLNTHRHANHAGGNAHLPAGLIGHAHVRGGDRVTQRGVEAAQRRSVLGELQRQHKLVDFLQILRQLCFPLPQP